MRSIARRVRAGVNAWKKGIVSTRCPVNISIHAIVRFAGELAVVWWVDIARILPNVRGLC